MIKLNLMLIKCFEKRIKIREPIVWNLVAFHRKIINRVSANLIISINM